MTTREDHRIEIAMGRTLQIGVILAALVVLAGGTLYLVQYHNLIASYKQFRSASAQYRSVTRVVIGALPLNSRNMIQFGILLLIATPLSRVIVGLVGFSIQKDRFYIAISLIILAILLTSLFWRR